MHIVCCAHNVDVARAIALLLTDHPKNHINEYDKLHWSLMSNSTESLDRWCNFTKFFIFIIQIEIFQLTDTRQSYLFERPLFKDNIKCSEPKLRLVKITNGSHNSTSLVLPLCTI